MQNSFARRIAVSATAALLLGGGIALSTAGIASSATHVRPAKTKITCNKGGATYCFSVQNTGSGNAMEGSAIAGIGLYGLSSSSPGVWGQSSSNFGVYGASQYNSGVDGYSPNSNGVEGASSSGAGVYGISSYDAGVYGYSSYGYGGYFESDSLQALYGIQEYPFGYLFTVVNAPNNAEFYVDNYANGTFSGTVTATGFNEDLRKRDGDHVAASIPLASRATIEDTGTARLAGGEGVVRFEPAFASAIDASRGYQVFLTPGGDTRGLYVSAKFEGGFVVRENEHGHSSVSFDYRVVAHPFGSGDATLPALNLRMPARPTLPHVPHLPH
jgi:hypothetical protein